MKIIFVFKKGIIFMFFKLMLVKKIPTLFICFCILKIKNSNNNKSINNSSMRTTIETRSLPSSSEIKIALAKKQIYCFENSILIEKIAKQNLTKAQIEAIIFEHFTKYNATFLDTVFNEKELSSKMIAMELNKKMLTNFLWQISKS